MASLLFQGVLAVSRDLGYYRIANAKKKKLNSILLGLVLWESRPCFTSLGLLYCFIPTLAL